MSKVCSLFLNFSALNEPRYQSLPFTHIEGVIPPNDFLQGSGSPLLWM